VSVERHGNQISRELLEEPLIDAGMGFSKKYIFLNALMQKSVDNTLYAKQWRERTKRPRDSDAYVSSTRNLTT